MALINQARTRNTLIAVIKNKFFIPKHEFFGCNVRSKQLLPYAILKYIVFESKNTSRKIKN